MAFTQFATDDFNRSDSGTLGANWTDQRAGIGIVSNQANASGGPADADSVFSYYDAIQPADDQASIATVVLISTTNNRFTGVTVRCSGTGSGSNAYWLLVPSSNSYLFKWINNTFTLLQTLGQNFSNGDRMRLEIVGDTLRAYRAPAGDPTNFAQIGSDQASGGELTSGYCGISLDQFPSTGDSGILDDWEGEEDAGGGGGSNQPMMRRWGGRSAPVPGIGQSSGGGKAWG
jgi:hypothetical protein